jgi:predicted SAM-dependent methyltransferase
MKIFKKLPWNLFFEEKIGKIFTEKKNIVDIGGGLRIDPEKNNRGRENQWVNKYLKDVNYIVLDKVPDYNPDIVGDIHNLPFEDNSIDAIICMNVLEHVEEPQKAVREIYRVLKPGGYCYIEVPFLLYYHPMELYYEDFFRFTKDGLKYMTKDFKFVEMVNVRGSISTVMNLFPFFTKKTKFFDLLDILFSKQDSNQTSAYKVFCIK